MVDLRGDDELVRQLSEMTVADVSSSGVALSEAERERNEQEQLDEVEALQSIYAEDFQFLERPKDNLRSFSIAVRIELVDTIHVVARLQESSTSVPSSSSSSSSSSLIPPLSPESSSASHSPSSSASTSKSTLSQNFSHSILLSHLPPIHLLCVLPTSYPSHSPPLFRLSCHYLNFDHLSKLCKGMDALWEEQGAGDNGEGQVVIYSWVDWLSRECLSYLGISNHLELGPYVIPSSEKSCCRDPRAISGQRTFEEDVSFLIRWDNSEKDERFRRDIHTCFVCFSEFSGSEFVRLSCNHFFCRNCMETFTAGHVTEGSVAKIVCPDTSCKAPFHPGLIRELLFSDAFSKWEELTFQKSLAAMADVTFCPRCSEVCVEEEDNCAQCSRCFYVFCGLCREAWHVGRPCMDAETRLKIIEERSKRNFGDAGQKQFMDLLNEVKSTQYLAKETKCCPSCKMAISKTEGCNKMTCSNCGSYFCYRCGKVIQGYDHFQNGQCVLFEAEEIARWEQMNQRPEMAAEGMFAHQAAVMWPERRRLCPSCRQENIKAANNNHILCWACNNHFCGLCGKVVKNSSEHYGPTKCKQHSR